MQKYLNKPFAKKLFLLGIILYVISFVLNFVTVFNVYGKVDDCLDKAAKCTLNTEQIVGKIAMVIGYAGIGIFIVGLVFTFIVWVKHRKR